MTKPNKTKKEITALQSAANQARAISRNFAPHNIAIMYRPGRNDAIQLAKELAAYLTRKGFRVFAAPDQTLSPKTPQVSEKTLDNIEWVIVLGGDGTYLHAVRLLEGRQVPILGVNMGSLGFLTETRKEDLYKAVDATLKNGMDFCPRSMLRVEVRRGGKLRGSHLALNDAVIERGSGTHLINLEIYSAKHLVANLKADALIIASPTGSTAYNLAAGGPILHPEVRAIVVTPVCPHALTSRPLIFPDDQQLSFRVMTRDKTAVLTVDGINCGEILFDDEVIVVRHSLDHFVIREPSANFFSLLREKLAFGQRD